MPVLTTVRNTIPEVWRTAPPVGAPVLGCRGSSGSHSWRRGTGNRIWRSPPPPWTAASWLGHSPHLARRQRGRWTPWVVPWWSGHLFASQRICSNARWGGRPRPALLRHPANTLQTKAHTVQRTAIHFFGICLLRNYNKLYWKRTTQTIHLRYMSDWLIRQRCAHFHSTIPYLRFYRNFRNFSPYFQPGPRKTLPDTPRTTFRTEGDTKCPSPGQVAAKPTTTHSALLEGMNFI